MTNADVLAKFGVPDSPSPIELPADPAWGEIAPGALGGDRIDFARWLYEWGLTRGAEIGTAGGDFAEVLLAAGHTLTCVDSWVVYPGYTDYTRQRTLDKAFALACSRLAQHYGHCTIVKKFSLEAARDIPDGSLDFVFIDANHQLLPVLQDIYAWTPKVRVGGIISGHDYAPSPSHQVVEAVDAYTSANHIHPWFLLGPGGDYTRTWFWVKQ
jgi:hypothetical protein